MMTNIGNTIDRNRTIVQQQEKETSNDQQKHHDNDYYNTTRTRASTVELPGNEVMEMIAESYKANISDRITGVAAAIIEEALRNGMEPATVILAIQETGMAPRPSPYYMAAVLRNWAETGVILSKSRGIHNVSKTNARPWWR